MEVWIVRWVFSLNFSWSSLPLSPVSGPVLVVVEGDGPVALHRGHVGPVVAGARQQHVTQQRLDGRLSHQAHKEQLLDDRRGDNAQRGQAQEQAAKAVGLAGVLVPHILLQGTLGLLLDALHVRHVRQTHGI